MNRLEISVIDPSAALQAFADAWHHAEQGHAQPARLAFGSLHELFEAITEPRLLLMRAVAERERAGIRELADTLGQDEAQVRADIDALLALGLLQRADDGELITPFDEIVIHAGIRDAA
jgi:predicted transcriptional regulator